MAPLVFLWELVYPGLRILDVCPGIIPPSQIHMSGRGRCLLPLTLREESLRTVVELYLPHSHGPVNKHNFRQCLSAEKYE